MSVFAVFCSFPFWNVSQDGFQPACHAMFENHLGTRHVYRHRAGSLGAGATLATTRTKHKTTSQELGS